MAKAIGMKDCNYSAFIAGHKGLSAQSTCLLLKFTSPPREHAIALFSKPFLSSQILQLKEKGKPMHFDNSGWVSGLSGQDANDTTDITDTPDAVTKLVGVGFLVYRARGRQLSPGITSPRSRLPLQGFSRQKAFPGQTLG
jgi:hypothetical protein